MKNAKKIVMGGVAALALVTASVMGTMAYFTSKTETVTNTFTVGDVNITLDEAKTDTLGEKVTPEVRVQENSYNLLPGHEYSKDPTVHVTADSEDCYLFITVEDQIAGAESATTVADQIKANHWIEVPNTTKGNATVYVYSEDSTNPTIVRKDATNIQNFTVFTTVTINENAKNLAAGEERKDGDIILSDYQDKKIIVNGYAIQADGFEGKTASEIWTAAGFNN